MSRDAALDAIERTLAEAAFRLRRDVWDIDTYRSEETEEILDPACEILEQAAASLEARVFHPAEVHASPPVMKQVEATLRGALAHAQQQGLTPTHEFDQRHEARWTTILSRADPLQALLLLYQPHVVADESANAHIAVSRQLGILPQEVEAISEGLCGDRVPERQRLRDWYELGHRLYDDAIKPHAKEK